jgi:hypothetical protein
MFVKFVRLVRDGESQAVNNGKCERFYQCDQVHVAPNCDAPEELSFGLEPGGIVIAVNPKYERVFLMNDAGRTIDSY